MCVVRWLAAGPESLICHFTNLSRRNSNVTCFDFASCVSRYIQENYGQSLRTAICCWTFAFVSQARCAGARRVVDLVEGHCSRVGMSSPSPNKRRIDTDVVKLYLLLKMFALSGSCACPSSCIFWLLCLFVIVLFLDEDAVSR